MTGAPARVPRDQVALAGDLVGVDAVRPGVEEGGAAGDHLEVKVDPDVAVVAADGDDVGTNRRRLGHKRGDDNRHVGHGATSVGGGGWWDRARLRNEVGVVPVNAQLFVGAEAGTC